MTATILQLIKLQKAILQAHQQVESVGEGEGVDRSASGNVAYPSAWIEAPYNFEGLGRALLNYRFAVLILDRPSQDDSDKLQAINKTSLIGLAFLERLKSELQERFGAELVEPWDAVSLEDFGDDSAAGWRFEFQIKAKAPIDQCGGPFDALAI